MYSFAAFRDQSNKNPFWELIEYENEIDEMSAQVNLSWLNALVGTMFPQSPISL